MTLYLVWLLTEFDITEYRFPCSICNGCGILTGDAYSPGHVAPSHLKLAYILLVENNPFPIKYLSVLSRLCFKNMFPNASLILLSWSTLPLKEGEANFVLSVNSLKPLRRKYNPVIIDMTMGLCLALLQRCISFLEHCTLTNKAWGLYDDACPQRRQVTDPGPSNCYIFLSDSFSFLT